MLKKVYFDYRQFVFFMIEYKMYNFASVLLKIRRK